MAAGTVGGEDAWGGGVGAVGEGDGAGVGGIYQRNGGWPKSVLNVGLTLGAVPGLSLRPFHPMTAMLHFSHSTPAFRSPGVVSRCGGRGFSVQTLAPFEMGALPLQMGASLEEMGVPPLRTGAEFCAMGAALEEMVAAFRAMVAAFHEMGVPPFRMGAEFYQMGAALEEVGATPCRTGVPPFGMGVAPISSNGATISHSATLGAWSASALASRGATIPASAATSAWRASALSSSGRPARRRRATFSHGGRLETLVRAPKEFPA